MIHPVVAVATICVLLQPVLLGAGPPLTESVAASLAAFMGPLPGTTYVYHYFRNGALIEGQEGLVEGLVREETSRIRLRAVTRLAEGPTGAPFEGVISRARWWVFGDADARPCRLKGTSGRSAQRSPLKLGAMGKAALAVAPDVTACLALVR